MLSASAVQRSSSNIHVPLSDPVALQVDGYTGPVAKASSTRLAPPSQVAIPLTQGRTRGAAGFVDSLVNAIIFGFGFSCGSTLFNNLCGSMRR